MSQDILERVREMAGVEIGFSVAEDITAEIERLRAEKAELLEVLKLALPYIEGAYEAAFPDDQENEYTTNQARVAIARAEGRQP